MKEELEIRIQKSNWSFNNIEILIKQGNAIVKEIIFEPIQQGAALSPVLSLSGNKAQQLMDDLWMAGVRPTEGNGSAGSLKATENHLSDMRTIAFNRLNIT